MNRDKKRRLSVAGKTAVAVLLWLVILFVIADFAWLSGSNAPKQVSADSAVWNGSVAAAYAGGTGTQSNPYLIATGEQLARMAQEINANRDNTANTYYALRDNIILNNTSNWTSWSASVAPTNSWTPINNFQGTFDGRGYAVKGIYINTTATNVGLFGTAAGTITNLGVTEGYIRSTANYVAGILGFSNSGSLRITNCYNGATVVAEGHCSAGIAAYIPTTSGIIANCYNTGAITNSTYWAAGISAVSSATILNCYNTGTITCSGTGGGATAGGIVGEMRDAAVVTNSYNGGTIIGANSGTCHTGGVVGITTGTSRVANCYNSGTVSGMSSRGSIIGHLRDTTSIAYSYWLSGTAPQAIGNGLTGTGIASFNTSGTLSPAITVNGASRTTLSAALSSWTGWAGGYIPPPAGVAYAAWNTNAYPTFVSLIPAPTRPAVYQVKFGVYNGLTGRGTVSAALAGAALTSGQLHQVNNSIVVTAAPAAGWAIKTWRNNGAAVTAGVSGDRRTYTFTLSGNVDVTVEFEQIWNISITGGTANPASGVEGTLSVLTYTGIPPANQSFLRWNVTGTGASVSGNDLKIGAGDVNVSPVFGSTVSYGVANNTGGTVTANTGASGTLVQAGSNVTFTAAPSAGWRVRQWYKDGAVVTAAGASATYTLTNLQAHTTVTVEFESAVSYLPGASGTGSAAADYKVFGTDITLSGALFTRTGYNQTGWNTAEDGAGTAYALAAVYSVNAPLTLYPAWTAISGITVNFNPGGGQPANPAPLSVTYDSPYGALPAVTREGGYNFGGWWTRNGTGGNWGVHITSATLVDNPEQHTLYARWLEDEYSISYFDAGGTQLSVPATGLPSMFEAPNGAVIPVPAERLGYAFAGWFLDADALTEPLEFYDGAYLLPGGGEHQYNVSLYAKWSPHQYAVRYYPNKPLDASGEVTGATANSAHACGEPKALNLNGFSLSGWHFTGWAASSGGTDIVFTDGQSVLDLTYANGGAVSLYAVWERNQYTVVYNQNRPGAAGANVTGSMSPSAYVYDGGASENLAMNAFRLTGWTFLGWMTGPNASVTDPEAAVVFADGAAIANLTEETDGVFNLYAVWRTNVYTVIYHGNQENGAAGSSGMLANATMPSVHKYDNWLNLTLNGFTLTGWHFTGWWTSEAGVGTRYDDGQSVRNLAAADGAEINLYAFWEPNTYTIQYRANKPAGAGGTVIGTTANSSHTYDVLNTLTRGGFSLTGWAFLGWSRNPDGSGTLYGDRQNVQNITPDNNATVILYARWRANSYTVKYDKNNPNAQGATSASPHTYDSSRRLTYNGFVLTGYTFEGWALSPEPGVSAVFADGELVINLTAAHGAEITLYAVWSSAEFTITFKMPQIVDENQQPLYPDIIKYAAYGDLISALIPAPPTMPGMVFARWEGLITGQRVPEMIVTGNHVFAAVYVPASSPSYTIRFELEDGTEILSKTGVMFGTYIGEILPESPGWTGWTFVRWEGYEQWMTVTGDHVFTAVFELDAEQGGVTQYTLTFYDSDGIMLIYTAQAFEGSSISAYFPAVRQKEGYVFMGWQGYVFGMTVTGNQSFIAEYKTAPVPVFTVIFYDEDGETVVLRLDNVPQGTIVSSLIPSAPLREGKTFIRWDGLGIYMTVESNHSFTAVYRDTSTLKYYTVIFYDDDGISVIKEITLVPDGTPVSSLFPADPFKPGYVFSGWKGYIANMNVAENLFFTAIFTKAPVPSYTVTFLDMWGGVFYQATNVPYGTLISMIVPPSAPVVDGWTFVSWRGYESWMTIVTSNHVFQAQYRFDPVPDGITVRFLDEDQMTVIAVRGGILQGTSISALFPQPPVKDGRVFVGWKYYDEDTGAWLNYQPGMTAESDIVFKAVYAEDDAERPLPKYTVTFLNFDDTVLIELWDIPQGTLVSMLLPAAPPRQGYVFIGWEYRLGGQWIACPNDLEVSEDMTLRTVWQAVGLLYELRINGAVVGRYEADTSFYVYITIPYGQEFDRWDYVYGIANLPAPDANGRVFVTMPARDVSVNPVFKDIPKFRVEFITGDGNVPAPEEQWVLRDGMISPVAVPTKDGYMFLGWFAEGSSVPWNFAADKVTQDITLTAGWKQVAFTVTVDGVYQGEYKSGTAVTVWLQIPDGKYFDGWQIMTGVSSVILNGDGSFTFTMPENEVVLVADYGDIPAYQVAFDTGDENIPAPENQWVLRDGLVTPVAVPTKDGYMFLGWFAEGSSAPWNFAADKVTKSTTLTARWKQVAFTVTVDGVYQGEHKSGTVVTVWLHVPEGKYFDGWQTLTGIGSVINNGDGSFTFIMPENDVALTAEYRDIPSYHVTFDTGDENVPAPEGQWVLEDGLVAPVAAPTKDGYMFLGWFAEGSDTLWDFAADKVTEDITLTARWKQVAFTVTVDGVYQGEYRSGTAVTFWLQMPEGKYFDGWQEMTGVSSVTRNADGSFTFIMPEADVVLIASYGDIAAYQVIFDTGDENVPAPGEQWILWGGRIAPVAVPTRAGYMFLGWFAEVSGMLWDFASDTVTDDITLTARWKQVAFTVTVDGVYQGVYKSGTAVTVWLHVPEGKYFDGWQTLTGIGSVINNGDGSFTFVMPENDVALTADYGSIPAYTITFDTDGGSYTPGPQTVYEGGKASYAAPPSKAGYVFLYWYDDTNGDGVNEYAPYDFNAPVLGPLTLKAKWFEESSSDDFYLKTEGVTGSGLYAAKDEVTVWLQIPAGKEFNGSWTLKGIQPADLCDNGDGSFTFVMPANNVEITAGYQAVTYKINVVGGYYQGTPEYGETIRLAENNPSPSTHRLIRFESPDVAIIYDGSGYMFIMPAHDVTITAIYEQVGGSVVYPFAEVIGATGTGFYAEGYLVTVWLQVPVGMEFERWTLFGIDDIFLNADGSYSFTMPGADVELEANYRFVTYTVTVEGGAYDGDPQYGNIITLYHDAPPMGKRFVRYESNSVIIVFEDGGYIFRMPAHDVGIYAVFEDIPRENGFKVRITGATGSGEYANGTVLTVWLQIPEGKRFGGWAKMTGIPEGWLIDNGDGSYTFTVYGRNVELEASYTDIPEFTVRFEIDDETVKEQTLLEGNKITYIIPEDKEGYVFLGWFYGDTLWDFENGIIGADVTLTARWLEINAPGPAMSGWFIWLIVGLVAGMAAAVAILVLRRAVRGGRKV